MCQDAGANVHNLHANEGQERITTKAAAAAAVVAIRQKYSKSNLSVLAVLNANVSRQLRRRTT